MIYTHGNIPHQHIAKEYMYYIHHNNMLVHNGLAAVIYGKSFDCANWKISVGTVRFYIHLSRKVSL